MAINKIINDMHFRAKFILWQMAIKIKQEKIF